MPQAELGAPLAIILGATSMGLIITTIWSAALGQTAVAAIFGIFAAFWLSYFLLVTGLIRGWFGIAPVDVQSQGERPVARGPRFGCERRSGGAVADSRSDPAVRPAACPAPRRSLL